MAFLSDTLRELRHAKDRRERTEKREFIQQLRSVGIEVHPTEVSSQYMAWWPSDQSDFESSDWGCIIRRHEKLISQRDPIVRTLVNKVTGEVSVWVVEYFTDSDPVKITCKEEWMTYLKEFIG